MKDKPKQINGARVPYEESVESLRALLGKQPPICWVGFVALGYKDSDKALDALADHLQSEDQYYRRAALEAIGNHPDGRTLEKEILACFRDPSEYVVRQACDTAAELMMTSAHDLVYEQLDSTRKATRCKAISAISKLWEHADFDKLLAVFQKDRDSDVQKEAAWVLFEHASLENWMQLFGLWSNDELPRHREWACKLAQRFGSAAVTPELERLTRDPDGHVRKAALIALGKDINMKE